MPSPEELTEGSLLCIDYLKLDLTEEGNKDTTKEKKWIRKASKNSIWATSEIHLQMANQTT